MAVTSKAAKKATPAKAKAPAKKVASKRGLNKGQAVECEVCGLAVTVDQIGDEVVEEDAVLLCCGKPMKKAKAAAKKAPAKAAAKK